MVTLVVQEDAVRSHLHEAYMCCVRAQNEVKTGYVHSGHGHTHKGSPQPGRRRESALSLRQIIDRLTYCREHMEEEAF